MRENVYILYDNNATIGLKPFIISRNDVQPVREITEVTNDPKSMIYKNADDFDLLCIGSIDLESLDFESESVDGHWRLVVRCKDLLDTTKEHQ